MYDTQTDLLSYSHIESEVDGLFRAYLDTSLMAYAQDCEDQRSRTAYWRAVDEFKKGTLSSVNGEGYQYWFDVRADYWSQHPAKGLKELVDGLVPKNYLGLLVAEARALAERLQHIGTQRDSLRRKGKDSAGNPSVPGVLNIVGGRAEADDESNRRKELSETLAKVVQPWKPATA